MSVAEFKEFLLQLAALYDDSAKREVAAGLRKLAEIFDETQNQKLAQFLDEIKQVRGV